MTREEAVAKLDGPRIVQYPGDFVDALVALGLLTLDEPKSLDDKLRDIIGFLGPAAGPEELKYAVDSCGLRIVDKDTK